MNNEIRVSFSNSRDKWCVSMDNDVYSTHSLKQRAEKKGRSVAKSNQPSRFVVERKSGGVSYTQFYGDA